MALIENAEKINQTIQQAVSHSDHPNRKIELITVTKGQPIQRILEAYSTGFRKFGENYANELLQKQKQLPSEINKNIQWHFIGKLQRNKVRKILPNVRLIHSVDSIQLAEKINQLSSKLNIVTPILIQVNIANEPTKNGIAPTETEQFVNEIRQLDRVCICGLMIMPPIGNLDNTTQYFVQAKHLFEQIKKQQLNENFGTLSMGTSSDYQLAIREGSTLVRIGTALFGERQQ